MNKLKAAFGDLNSENRVKTAITWSDLTSGHARKALTIGIALCLLYQFCGLFALLNYTATIFEEAGSSIPPNDASIVVGSIQLAGSYFATVFIERAGRKVCKKEFKFYLTVITGSLNFQPMLIISSLGTALGLIALATYMMLKSWNYAVEAYNWIPLVSFSYVLFMGSLAVLTMPFIVISEVMPAQIREFGVSLCVIINNRTN